MSERASALLDDARDALLALGRADRGDAVARIAADAVRRIEWSGSWLDDPYVPRARTSRLPTDPGSVQGRLRDLTDTFEARLAMGLDGPVYRLHHEGGWALADAVTGRQLSPIDAPMAQRVAEVDYAGPGAVRNVVMVDEPSLEIRGMTLPVWRVEFDDSEAEKVPTRVFRRDIDPHRAVGIARPVMTHVGFAHRTDWTGMAEGFTTTSTPEEPPPPSKKAE